MGAQTIPQTVLFADIAGSTALLLGLGDDAGRELIVHVLQAMQAVIDRQGGRVVDQIGDELMCAFASTDSALTAAIKLHRRVAELGPTGVRVHLRIGFHVGDVVEEGGRLFGDAVHTARRMATAAKADQIIVSGATLRVLDEGPMMPTRLVTMLRMKGHDEAIEAHEIIWDPKVSTYQLDSARLIAAASRELVLSHRGTELVLHARRGEAMIGRGPDCDLVLDLQAVSRRHARIELRDSGFVLVDMSTNGTRVTLAGAEARFVRRGEVPLAGEGHIEFGADGPADPEGQVTFTAKTSSP